MKKDTKFSVVVGTVTVLLLGSITFGIAADTETTSVSLKSNSGSGVNGTAVIDGKSVTGKASGLDPSKRYISLYYGSQSTASTGKQLTCADVRTAANPRGWGISPEWTVDDEGNGTLSGTARRDLSDVKTMSIRQLPSGAGQDPYVGFNPVQYPVVACGAVSNAQDDAVTDTVNQVPTDVTSPVLKQVPSNVSTLNDQSSLTSLLDQGDDN